MKIQAIDAQKRIITFADWPDQLHLAIVEQGYINLIKPGGEIKKKEATTPKIGDGVRLASNYGRILLTRDYNGVQLDPPVEDSPSKLQNGGVIENILAQGNDTILMVKPISSGHDQRIYKIIMSNRVTIIQNKK